MLHAEEDADHVDVEHPAKAFQRVFRDRLDVALDPGVVVEGIDGAEAVDAGADVFLDFILLGDVGGDGQRLGRSRQVLDGGYKIGAFAVDRDNARTALGQQP